MPLEYINRRGDRYFVLQGKTKTGKPKYYCSRKSGGMPVEQLPDGFELHESPVNAIVSVRKHRATEIAPIEREQLADLCRRCALAQTIVDVDGDSLVVYVSDVNPDEALRTIEMLIGPMGAFKASNREWMQRNCQYSPMLRFRLVDADHRLFVADRWCYLGSVDDWYPLSGGEPLLTLAEQYVPHLGKESFFELM